MSNRTQSEPQALLFARKLFASSLQDSCNNLHELLSSRIVEQWDAIRRFAESELTQPASVEKEIRAGLYAIVFQKTPDLRSVLPFLEMTRLGLGYLLTTVLGERFLLEIHFNAQDRLDQLASTIQRTATGYALFPELLFTLRGEQTSLVRSGNSLLLDKRFVELKRWNQRAELALPLTVDDLATAWSPLLDRLKRRRLYFHDSSCPLVTPYVTSFHPWLQHPSERRKTKMPDRELARIGRWLMISLDLRRIDVHPPTFSQPRIATRWMVSTYSYSTGEILPKPSARVRIPRSASPFPAKSSTWITSTFCDYSRCLPGNARSVAPRRSRS